MAEIEQNFPASGDSIQVKGFSSATLSSYESHSSVAYI
jgi:hypothetical protein